MSKKKTSIQKFYEGKVIFLTGATGFIGKLLLEKCLRSLNLKKIYILVRVKKGKDQNTRLKKLLESPIYDKVKSLNPNFFEKISILNGDLTCPNLGLSDEDIKILINEVDCIIHCAATVSFVEHLSLATKMNVIASRDLLRIAKKMHNLHVSISLI
ncbi:unnamed protein product [Brassicogethes aeneus]|uniref:Fatty acyl-CoA reductase n=1 Tax=Brassicogethes aeneus TaxID=1431903 RepID=A0A9P0FGH9_BRAAE|nr:unnamed protein product [Brassicogethes aeneus]